MIGGLILVGFVLAKARGRPAAQPLPAGAMAMAAPVGTEQFGDGVARAEPAGVNAAGAYPWLERELLSEPMPAPGPSALEDAQAPTATSVDETGAPPASAIAADPWASAKTIAIHVEQIDLGED
ncbi:MAG TPA: hypothetical protein VFP56_06790 [Candidatus Limnocylindrales bacterium]|nr:hypothetical protein [Candidatus Limnocylindrales bacterium]